ncbi:pE66L [African swine fever virus]|uniref:PE66L n=1 Tax=African swine fever virus TaxID=10497 RepID=A0A894KS65_ASF|nr:pE66L [African swine fever virus]
MHDISICINMYKQHMVTLYVLYAHIICIQNMVILMCYMHIYVFYRILVLLYICFLCTRLYLLYILL